MNPNAESESPMMPDQNNSASPGGSPVVSATVASEGPARPGTTDVQAYIGRQLRAVYDDVVKQPIPDRFLALMKQLEEQTPGS